jgi:hypothetical protein
MFHSPEQPRIHWRIKSEYGRMPEMDEGRKRVLLIAASILAARKLAQSNPPPRSPAFEAAIADALSTAERIMKRIDERFPQSRHS